LFTLGLRSHSWDHRRASHMRGVGAYEVTTFSPGRWRPTGPIYLPMVVADRFDNFWGAKIVMRFTREQLRAAVEAGRLSDSRSVEHLTNVLVARQRATGEYWFSRVNPLDNFAATSEGVCFDDLMLTYQLAPAGTPTRYSLQVYDRAGRAIGRSVMVAANTSGRTCVRTGLANDYTIVRISTTRPKFQGTTYLHLAREPETQAPRVIGLQRT
jgi:hypothetical protein